MQLERPELFDRRTFAYFLALIGAIALVSLLNLYSNFKELQRFDTAEIRAEVLNHYVKTKAQRRYGVLKLQSEGVIFYTTGSAHLKNLQGRTIDLLIWPSRLSFLEYLRGFYVHSALLGVAPELSTKERLNRLIAKAHHSKWMAELYGALFTASPMNPNLRNALSALGVSHLLAISGFHLGLLSLFVYGILYGPYRLAQSRYFPYRHRNRDLFVATAVILGLYLLILGWIPSLIRAFAMLLVGYILYDRGLKVISMQTLFVSILGLLALWPQLFFTLGFWLSVAGVYYIFLLLHYFSGYSKIVLSVMIAAGVYLMMLPFSLSIFESFSLWHPLSIVWSLLFILFYPLVLLLHVIGYGDILDLLLLSAMQGVEVKNVALSYSILGLHVTLSLLALRGRRLFVLSLVFALGIFVSAIQQIA